MQLLFDIGRWRRGGGVERRHLPFELDNATTHALGVAFGVIVASVGLLGNSRRCQGLFGGLVARDLGFCQRVLRNIARTFEHCLGLRGFLQLDFELG